MYAVVSVTEYYGPRADCFVLSLHKNIGEARTAADKYAHDYDASVGAHRLAHNQSSPTRGEVYEVLSDAGDDAEAYGDADDIVFICLDLDGYPYVIRSLD